MDMVIYEKPIRLELAGNVLFVNGNQHPKDTRTLAQMKDTLMGEAEGNADAYYMYRNVYKENDLRYDITVIPAASFGGECAKTHGHYHPVGPDDVAYPEIYQVLGGSALFILQRRNRNGSVDVTLVDAQKGDVVLMPPGYGHITVNTGEGTLVLANLVYDKFASLYEEYRRNRGGAYYYTSDHAIVHNTNYIVHQNERIRPDALNRRYGFSCDDILKEFYTDPHRFAFLAKPKML